MPTQMPLGILFSHWLEQASWLVNQHLKWCVHYLLCSWACSLTSGDCVPAAWGLCSCGSIWSGMLGCGKAQAEKHLYHFNMFSLVALDKEVPCNNILCLLASACEFNLSSRLVSNCMFNMLPMRAYFLFHESLHEKPCAVFAQNLTISPCVCNACSMCSCLFNVAKCCFAVCALCVSIVLVSVWTSVSH